MCAHVHVFFCLKHLYQYLSVFVCIICMFGSCFGESVMWHDKECRIHLSVTIIVFRKARSLYQRCMASFPTQTAKFSSNYVMTLPHPEVWLHYVQL